MIKSAYKRLLVVGLVSGLMTAFAGAQSYNAFNGASGIYGIDVSNVGLTYTVTFDPGAYLVINATHYDITDIFGFWTVSGTSPINGTGADQGGWNWNSHSTGGGYTAGWTNDPKDHDIQAGGSMSFTYTGLSQSNVEGYGFHFSLAQSFNGSNTAF